MSQVVPEPFVPLTDKDEDSVRRALGGKNRFSSSLLLLRVKT